MNIKLLALSILFSPLVAYAQGEIGISLRDFKGGINDNTATIALKPDESPDALNVVIDEPWGNLKTRRGRLACGNTPSGNQVTNTHEYIRSNGNHDLILTDNITVWSTQDCVIFSTITTGLNEIAAPYFDTFWDKLWIVNKSTHVITWDGTTATLLDGVGSHPNPPVSQYITHWKERVWVARTVTEPSAVYFTDLTNDAGTNIDPSLSSRAWPTTNAFYIAQEDGSPIYAIKVYRDNLFVFKETGIWRIIFESVYNTQVVKSVSNVGCKFQDSIIELDNFLYFVGNDGIYKFDGNDVLRISDNITTTFKRLKQPSRLDKFQLWDTAADWVEGGQVSVSTAVMAGSVSLAFDTGPLLYDSFSDGDYTAGPPWLFGTGSNIFFVSGGYLYYDTDTTGALSGYVYSSTPTLNWGNWSLDFNVGIMAAGFEQGIKYYFISDSSTTSSLNGYMLYIHPATSGSNFTISLNSVVNGTEAQLSAITKTNTGTEEHGIKILTCTAQVSVSISGGVTTSICGDTSLSASLSGFSPGNSRYQVLWAQNNRASVQPFLPNAAPRVDNVYIPGAYTTSGTFTSQISTFSALTQWRTFDVDGTLNGQTIAYSVRTATSAYNLGLASYRAITSGSQISTNTTHTIFQWKADLTTADTSLTPRVDAITANYVEGDASATRLMAVNYDNRYMLTGSTTAANDYNDIVLVKTKAPLDNWTVYDWQISAFTRWNNNLYGGVSNSSAISRFDYGSNDNGAAINAYWTWGDQHWDRMSYKKNLKEIYAYYIPTGLSANTFVSYSINGGTNWTDKTINMTGTSAFGTKRLNINGGIGNAFRFKISNTTLDESFNVLGLDLWASPYITRE